MATYKRRLSRIFNQDGRTLIVAMDHGSQGPMPGLERPEEILEEVVAGGADAILTSLGIATTYCRLIERCGLILRIDGGTGFGTQDVQVWQRYPVSNAVAIGADAVGCMGLIGWPCEAANIRYVNRLASECLPTAMPLMVEVLPYSQAAPGPVPSGRDGVPNLAAGISKGVRAFAEFGADFIKAQYTGDPSTFRRVVEATYVPIVILGGPKADSDLELLTTTYDAISAGAAGVAFGRNIWQHRTPKKLVQALHAVIHDGARPEQAIGLLG